MDRLTQSIEEHRIQSVLDGINKLQKSKGRGKIAREEVLYVNLDNDPRFKGRLDSSNGPEMREYLRGLLDDPKNQGSKVVVLDMEDFSYIGSPGWFAFIEVQKKLIERFDQKTLGTTVDRAIKTQEGFRPLVLLNLQSGIKSSLELVHLQKYFTLYPALKEKG